MAKKDKPENPDVQWETEAPPPTGKPVTPLVQVKAGSPPPVDPNAPPVTLDEVDLSEQEPAPPEDPAVAEPPVSEGIQFESSPPPVQQITLPNFREPPPPPPETILFNQPPPAPEPAPTPPTAQISAVQQPGKTETMVLLELVNKLVDGRQTQPQAAPITIPPTGSTVNLEEAVMTLLAVPGFDRYVTAIREIARNHANNSLVGWLLGLINLHGDRGTLGEIAYNPDWEPYLRNSVVTSGSYVSPVIATCEYCGHPYRPPMGGNIRQRFCCNACGKKANGSQEEPMPHSPDCTTDAGKLLQQVMTSSKPAVAA